MTFLSIVVPAYNEAGRIRATIRAIARYVRDGPFRDVELIVVDDGSADGTGDAAEKARPDLADAAVPLRVLRNGWNRGKGYSVRRGLLASEGEWMLFSDADLSAPIGELEKLMQAATAGDHHVAIGSRALNRSLIGVRQPRHRELAGKLFNVNVRLLTGLDIADTQCGFKLFRRKAAREIAARQVIERFGFDVEQLFLARKLGYSVTEVPVQWDDHADSSVGVADGLKAFAEVWRVKWNDLTGAYS